MASQVPFRWLLTLFALAAPAALGPSRAASQPDTAPGSQTAGSAVVFRHYL